MSNFEPPKPTHYGITGADAEYIKKHRLVPDEKGAYPRLDQHSTVERIPSGGLPGEHSVPIDIPDDQLLLEITRARAIYDGLLKLYKSRTRWDGISDRTAI